MEKIITYENLRSFCYSNDKLIEGEIKGIAIDFNGLGGQGMHKEHSRGDFFAKYGIIFITINAIESFNLRYYHFVALFIGFILYYFKLDIGLFFMAIGVFLLVLNLKIFE